MIAPKPVTIALSQYFAPTFRSTMLDGTRGSTTDDDATVEGLTLEYDVRNKKEQRDDRVSLPDVQKEVALHASALLVSLRARMKINIIRDSGDADIRSITIRRRSVRITRHVELRNSSVHEGDGITRREDDNKAYIDLAHSLLLPSRVVDELDMDIAVILGVGFFQIAMLHG